MFLTFIHVVEGSSSYVLFWFFKLASSSIFNNYEWNCCAFTCIGLLWIYFTSVVKIPRIEMSGSQGRQFLKRDSIALYK